MVYTELVPRWQQFHGGGVKNEVIRSRLNINILLFNSYYGCDYL